MKQMEERYKRYVEKAKTVSPPEQVVLSAWLWMEISPNWGVVLLSLIWRDLFKLLYLLKSTSEATRTKRQWFLLHRFIKSRPVYNVLQEKNTNVLLVQVINTMDPKQQPAAPHTQALKNQLTEKERRILHLEVTTILMQRHNEVTLAQVCMMVCSLPAARLWEEQIQTRPRGETPH